MPELRWILIVFGAALLLGIYLWGRRSSRQAADSEESMLRTQEPHSAYVFRDEPSAEVIEPFDDEPPGGAEEEFEPIVADRRQRHVEAADEADESEEPIREMTEESPAPAQEREARRGRIEPKFGDGEIEAAAQPSEPVRAAAAPTPASAAPTLSMSNTPPPRRSDRRKIMALRIAAGAQRFPGEQLLGAMEADGLQHGKYDVFHRLDAAGATLFSVASMVEPGTFDPQRMTSESFPGVTLFTQLPGAVESMLAFNEMVQTARRMQEKLGGTLQDERGVPLTVHRLERLRQDIRDFDQGHAAHRAEAAPSAAP